MLDLSLVVNVLIIRRFEEGGVKDLVLDLCMDLERLTDLPCEGLLAAGGVSAFELFEPCLYLTVVRLQKRDGVVGGRPTRGCAARGASARPTPLCPRTLARGLSCLGHISSR